MCLNNLQHIEYDAPSETDLKQLDLDFDFTDECTYIPDDHKFSHEPSDLSVTQLNIRGLLGKTSDLTKLLNKFREGRQLDIVTLNETWLSDQTNSMVNIEGYTLETVNRQDKKGGGVGFLVSKYLN